MTSSWAFSTVGGQFDVVLGKMLDSDRNAGTLKAYLGNRAVQWGRIDIGAAGVVPLTASDLRRFRLRAGDLLVCEGGEVGRAAIWNDELSECYFQKALHRLRPRSDYDARLMLAFLRYWSLVGGFANFVTQTSIAHLPREKFVQMPLPLPERAEQRAIGDVLEDVDGLIASLVRLIAKKRDIRQGMMQELLTGRTRLPGFADDWRPVRLGDVLTVRHGRDQKAVEVVAGRYKILATGGQIGTTNTPLYSKPSVLIGRKGTIDRPQYQDEPFWSVDTLFYTEIRDGADPKYFFYVFQTVDWRSMNEASGVPSLSSGRVESVEVLLPMVDEQRAIRAVLDDADAEITALERRLESARAVKVGMMQELLTGRTRLPFKEEA